MHVLVCVCGGEFKVFVAVGFCWCVVAAIIFFLEGSAKSFLALRVERSLWPCWTFFTTISLGVSSVGNGERSFTFHSLSLSLFLPFPMDMYVCMSSEFPLSSM